MKEDMSKYPIVLCTPTADGWEFWCPFCKRMHSHSAGVGHRVAHCHTDDYEYGGFPHGYVLRRDTKANRKRDFKKENQ